MRTFMQFLQEVSRDHLALVGQRINKYIRRDIEDEPFNDIFGDKSRIVIPLMDEKLQQFTELLGKMGLTRVDLREGTGVVKVETQQGVKDRTVKIGKFLQNQAKLDPQNGMTYTQWLSWWEKEKPNLSKPGDDSYSIIVSRHPIDIIRMSDHDGMSSCHAPDGQFWKCAVQEAKTGGAVAYVVSNEDLAQVKNLQAKDIFKDDDRRVDGIEPLSRLRLRRYEDGNNDYLVPIMRSYGGGYSGFYESLRSWALSAQADKLQDVDYKRLNLKGGSYEDWGNKSPDIWSKFLGKTFTGARPNVDQDLEQKNDNGRDEAEEQVEEMMRDANNRRLTQYSVYASVEDYDENGWYVSYGGSTEFDFSSGPGQQGQGYEFIKPLPGWRDQDPNGWQIKREIEKKIKDACDIWGIEYIEFENGDTIRLDIRDHDGELDVNGFENFIDNVEDWDKSHAEHKQKIAGILRDMGFIRNPVAEMQLQYLKSSDDTNRDGEWEVNWETQEPTHIGSLAGLPVEQIMVMPGGVISDITYNAFRPSRLDEDLKEELNTQVRQLVPLEEHVNISCTISAPETHSPAKHHEDDYYLGSKPMAVHEDVPVMFSFEVFATDPTPEDLQSVQAIDSMMPRIIELAKDWWQRTVIEIKQEVHGKEGDAHPGVRANAARIEQILSRMGQHGKVTLRNGQYWYTDTEGTGIDMPVQQAYQMFKTGQEVAQQIASIFQYKMRRWRGSILVKYVGGRPQFWWNDAQDGSQLPVAQALQKFLSSADPGEQTHIQGQVQNILSSVG